MKEGCLHTVCVLVAVFSSVARSLNYKSNVAIMKEVVEHEDYRTDVRPLKDQEKAIQVSVDFELVSIVGIDDVAQSFIVNGFVFFLWNDEMLTWDPSKYDNQAIIHPMPEKIWRPRVLLLNTLGERDIFQEDDLAPVTVDANGTVNWVPGSLFPTSCELHLSDYPFDEQKCTIILIATMYDASELSFVAITDKVLLDFFIKHGEWELIDTDISTTSLSTSTWEGSSIQFTFKLRRRPAFLLINIVLPVVFLSFLNLMVFIIPADSGEKISYGITVLLALSVFLSIVGSLLPRSGASTPKLTIYLFMLLIISMLTVIDSIIIVYLDYKDEQETSQLKAKANFQSAFSKTQKLTRAVSTFLNKKPADEITNHQGDLASRDNVTSFADAVRLRSQTSVDAKDEAKDAKDKKPPRRVNKYRLIGKHIDCVSFIVFLFLWILVTLIFLLTMAYGKDLNL
ncbi:neuronal acetylcholine receptor subunit alpha-6-like [Biomphalaria glabrata]|uniref:Neuronal acetylcholine receptor subunit alpha-6-like n=1 Tax=Biomphalaria glabrata TaxID=6526 RepID=A0A9W3B3S3_BIOGL|nr:neuronal acetylcholine receptor subunit alpha-6-like [Biomphalaria glabrata]XP_055894105.1 neuronal acetylcholine receptor subunit alpha-6-like [Biomphalaria glabrata]XP_055894106.1 neuronal acetylcholine receptor subunit alpha-6-like [Biomphalaria glabrata]XP_055894107.1 neuronal acetylcholine receptor subunit alpha-6-like [Biomphalaria glabrata]